MRRYTGARRHAGRDDGFGMAETIIGVVLFSILAVLALRLAAEVSVSKGRRSIASGLEAVTAQYLGEARLADCALWYATYTPNDPTEVFGESTQPGHPCAVPLQSHNTRVCSVAEQAARPVSASWRICLDVDHHSAVVDVWDLYRPPVWCDGTAMLYTDPRCVPVPERIVAATHPGGLHKITRATVGRSIGRVDAVWVALQCPATPEARSFATVGKSGAGTRWRVVIKDGEAFVVGDAGMTDFEVVPVDDSGIAQSAPVAVGVGDAAGRVSTPLGSWC